jgi:hypothetical protein
VLLGKACALFTATASDASWWVAMRYWAQHTCWLARRLPLPNSFVPGGSVARAKLMRTVQRDGIEAVAVALLPDCVFLHRLDLHQGS